MSRLAVCGSVVFALLCFGYAAVGFWNAADLPTDALRGDAHGFAWFWLFLGSVGVACAVGYWRTAPRDAVAES